MDAFDYNSRRAKESRLGRIFESKPLILLMWLLVVAAGVFGLYLLFIHASVGWLLVGLGVAMAMFLIWNKYALATVEVGKTEDINDILSRDLLRAMPKEATPAVLAKAIAQARSGRFFALRFGITGEFLDALAGSIPTDVTPIFQRARAIRQKTNSEDVSGAVLAIAMLEQFPNHEMVLKQMRLELKDLYDGVNWYNYLYGMVKGAKKPRRTGGIGRDLSFGYIPTLERFGQNISQQRGTVKTQIHMSSHKDILEQMVQVFSSGGRQNVALIGPSGSGRSTIVNAFAEELLDADSKLPSDLKFRQVFMLDAGSLISAAGAPGQLEGLVRQILGEAYAAKNIIICLDNAQLFFEEGVGSVDISNVLLPIIEAGRLRMILTMDQQKYLEISARNSALANALNKIMVEPANFEETMKVMEDQVPMLEYKHKVLYTYWSLGEAYRLGARYVHDLEMPGQALSLLESAASYADQGFVVAESVQKAVEKTQGVKMQATQTADDRERLLNMEGLIHERMIDQEGAVKTVSDALRRAAAGVRNENRPIGTFLFLGPTGVGKTELAKAISEVYFGGESEIVRIDLNEYVAASDVVRLIADGAEDGMSLTAQVMKQPFSVVLLDEIEKAHPQVLTTLLQVLDEGILRDTKNHEVSFRDAIIIATTNAGADKVREYISAGYRLEQFKEQLTNELIATGAFKPEFLNRFDEICVFEPLSKENLAKIVDLIIKSTNKTLAPQKITVTLDDEARMLLVEAGYDPQMGARPMRRIVQKVVENLVAKMVLSGELASGGELHLTGAMVREQLAQG